MVPMVRMAPMARLVSMASAAMRGVPVGPAAVRRAAVLCLVFVAAIFAGERQAAAGAGRALRIVQRTGGLQGKTPDSPRESVLQALTVDPEGKRLMLAEYPGVEWPDAGGGDALAGKVPVRQFILRLDREPAVIWEVNPEAKEYREHAGDLNRHQQDRRIQELNLLELAKKMAPRERDEFYKDNYLRRDGKRIVTVTREPGETLVGRPCEHVIVKENDRLILDAQLTKDVPGARSYFHLYRRLGAFSEEVLEKLAAVEGVPLRAKITVVTALPTYTLDVEVLDLREVEVTPAVFELPAGSKKLDELPAELLCGNCGMQLEKDSLRIPAKYRRPDGSWVYFCSEACAETYVDATEKADPKVKPK